MFIPPEVVMLLRQAYLRVLTVDPIAVDRETKQDKKGKFVYRKWGIAAMDDSLFVSDGTSEDGGMVRLKVSDKTQKEIAKVKPIVDTGNYIRYYDTYG